MAGAAPFPLARFVRTSSACGRQSPSRRWPRLRTARRLADTCRSTGLGSRTHRNRPGEHPISRRATPSRAIHRSSTSDPPPVDERLGGGTSYAASHARLVCQSGRGCIPRSGARGWTARHAQTPIRPGGGPCERGCACLQVRARPRQHAVRGPAEHSRGNVPATGPARRRTPNVPESIRLSTAAGTSDPMKGRGLPLLVVSEWSEPRQQLGAGSPLEQRPPGADGARRWAGKRTGARTRRGPADRWTGGSPDPAAQRAAPSRWYAVPADGGPADRADRRTDGQEVVPIRPAQRAAPSRWYAVPADHLLSLGTALTPTGRPPTPGRPCCPITLRDSSEFIRQGKDDPRWCVRSPDSRHSSLTWAPLARGHPLRKRSGDGAFSWSISVRQPPQPPRLGPHRPPPVVHAVRAGFAYATPANPRSSVSGELIWVGPSGRSDSHRIFPVPDRRQHGAIHLCTAPPASPPATTRSSTGG